MSIGTGNCPQYISSGARWPMDDPNLSHEVAHTMDRAGGGGLAEFGPGLANHDHFTYTRCLVFWMASRINDR